jgi:hypothetical protein
MSLGAPAHGCSQNIGLQFGARISTSSWLIGCCAQARKGQATAQPLPFNMKQIEGFRYRAEDSLKRVSRLAIRRARLQEVQTELLNAETLKSHFEENPQDLLVLFSPASHVLRTMGCIIGFLNHVLDHG